MAEGEREANKKKSFARSHDATCCRAPLQPYRNQLICLTVCQHRLCRSSLHAVDIINKKLDGSHSPSLSLFPFGVRSRAIQQSTARMCRGGRREGKFMSLLIGFSIALSLPCFRLFAMEKIKRSSISRSPLRFALLNNKLITFPLPPPHEKKTAGHGNELNKT
jgi:hypothetical protein